MYLHLRLLLLLVADNMAVRNYFCCGWNLGHVCLDASASIFLNILISNNRLSSICTSERALAFDIVVANSRWNVKMLLIGRFKFCLQNRRGGRQRRRKEPKNRGNGDGTGSQCGSSCLLLYAVHSLLLVGGARRCRSRCTLRVWMLWLD